MKSRVQSSGLAVIEPVVDFNHLLENDKDEILDIHKDHATGDYLLLIKKAGSERKQTLVIWNPASGKTIRENSVPDVILDNVEFLSPDLIWGEGHLKQSLITHETGRVVFLNRLLKPLSDRLVGRNTFLALSHDENTQIVHSSLHDSSLTLVTIVKEKNGSFNFIKSSLSYSQLTNDPAADQMYNCYLNTIARISDTEFAVLYNNYRVKFCSVEAGQIILKNNFDLPISISNHNFTIEMSFLNKEYLQIAKISSDQKAPSYIYYFAKSGERWQKVFDESRDVRINACQNLPPPFVAISKIEKAQSGRVIYDLEVGEEVPDSFISNEWDSHLYHAFIARDHFYFPLARNSYIQTESVKTLEQKINAILLFFALQYFPSSILTIIASYTPTLLTTDIQSLRKSSSQKILLDLKSSTSLNMTAPAAANLAVMLSKSDEQKESSTIQQLEEKKSTPPSPSGTTLFRSVSQETSPNDSTSSKSNNTSNENVKVEKRRRFCCCSGS